MSRNAAWAQKRLPLTFTRQRRSRSASVASSTGTFSLMTAAQFTSAVDAAQLGDDAIERGEDRVAVADVDADRQRPAALRLHERDRLRRRALVEIHDRDVRPGARRRDRDALADPLGGARHDDHLALEAERDLEV